MVNELRSLLHESSENAPYDDFDADSVLRSGRSRVRRHRTAVVGVAGLAAAAVLAVSTFALDLDPKADPARPTGPVSEPVGPVLTLDDATPVELDPIYRHVTEELRVTDARFVDGITDDGKAIVRDTTERANLSELMLVDLETGAEEPLPDIPGPGYSVLEGNADRIVYAATRDGQFEARALVLDLATRTWQEVRWPGLPDGTVIDLDVGPDDRMYVAIAADFDRADPAGATGSLWSMSLTDPTDVRDEEVTVGGFAIDGDDLVWSERFNGFSNSLTVRDLSTGEDTSFDPQSGRHCTQVSLGLDADRIIMTQRCGTQDAVTDDRVQVVSMSGEPVVTFQSPSIRAYAGGGGQLMIFAELSGTKGVYSYDLASGDFIRVGSYSSPVTVFEPWGPVADGYLMWSEGHNQGLGSVQQIARVP